uniref:YTH domain-containing family protein n=1 Tax=Musa acuminata subsp. malaccensis TaxID=214687 RepID=A0A804K128_MUSAM|nr:PREDICTED: uncharacterized protein LOC103993077 isoform X1 [Musa acuminata subsp. malaccensis]
MAAVALAADLMTEASDLLQKLSLDSPPKTDNAVEVAKEPPALQNGSSDCETPNMPIQSERSLTPLLPDFVDPSMCYVPGGYASPAYFYGGYDRAVNKWGDYSRYTNNDGVEILPGVYGDLYQGYGYAPYSAYPSNGSSVPTMGHDGQHYGPQQYQYPVPFFEQPTPTSTTQTPTPPTSQGEVSTSVAANQPSISMDTARVDSSKVSNVNANRNNGPGTMRSSHQPSSLTSGDSHGKGGFPGGFHSAGYQDSRFGFGGQHKPATSSSRSSTVTHKANNLSERNQNQHSVPHIVGKNAPVSRMYPINRFYGGNGLGNVFGYGFNGYDHRMNGRWGPPLDSKYNPRGRGNGFFGYGNEIQDGFSELNRGPRAGRSKNQKAAGTAPVFDLKGQNLSSIGNENSSVTLDREQYNGDDFPDKHSDARFFVIKSYSEDDIHKSIKYNVWTSTPNGNKKLDGGYQEAQEKDGGCPVFLFYSVNASGQFVGVAEMVGPVDFNKTVDYWQQDKWIGCFPVKWHIIKDVPNSLLKHITLENNDNKPVTNSRDTQEVRLEQGLQMLKIFKEHVSKTSVLDDFDFYENRQNFMQEKRVKQQLQKQVWTGKASHAPKEDEQDRTNGKPGSQPVSVLNKESAQGSLGEINTPVELGVAAAAGAPLKVLKPAVEKHVVANGVANGVA